ncbi:hypothetical protein FA15DRAFT_678064 [Coprinopsis marcescibilis]|uniref:Uncharacterized protein n=1 Tax=Coprinopsis marcescibilis TaxID=230819 RepID=A0A5C3L805_COPMA|nr:hypothetical protein FA15DRAFT_678064 [Coprinopsis marcescibilis]
MLGRQFDAPGPRPRPPAKMRRRSSLAALKPSNPAANPLSMSVSGRIGGGASSITSSPPPAYGVVDSDPLPDTLLGSPVPSTFRFKNLESPAKEWIDEKSREELADLLVKAGDIIKERENELGMTSAVVNNLYQSNIALKSKHEAFLARLPVSPHPSHRHHLAQESPEDFPRVISRNNSSSYSSSDSIHDNIHDSPISPIQPPPFYRRHARKVSMSTTEISLLADQNSELMSKLEQLQAESTSSDQAGRRELKRLEKEIVFLREALEKTQAKSQELEEKTKGLDRGIDKAVEDAWKRKREREMRIQTLKNVGREEEPRVQRDFAPRGSMLGSFSFSQSMSNLLDPDFDEDQTLTNDQLPVPTPEHDIFKQLLRKVQELEDTNTRIITQQKETAAQLHAVQRDAEQITKVYEYLGDTQDIDIEVEDDDFDTELATNSVKFGSSPNRLQSSTGRNKSRRSVVGLFEEPATQNHPPASSFSSLSHSWNDSRHRSSYSMDTTGGLVSPALSTLSFFNSPDISPAIPGRTLDAELGRHFKGETWGSQRGNYHLRNHSLSNLSQWSAPPSPSPGSGISLPQQVQLSSSSSFVPLVLEPSPLPTQPSTSLRVSLDPPTPEKRLRQSSSGKELRAQDPQQLHPGMSPRQQFISQRIHDRRGRWEDERFASISSVTSPAWDNKGNRMAQEREPVFVAPPKNRKQHLRPAPIPRRISSIVDSLVDRFEDAATEQNPDSESGYESDEGGDDLSNYDDSSFEDGNTEQEDEYDGYDEEEDEEDEEDETSMRTPQIAADNALQLHQLKPIVAERPKALKRSKNAAGGKWGTVLLELWLWLQFAVIIFVFLFAMAKRGPKAVLADAEQRTRTRKVSLHAKRH